MEVVVTTGAVRHAKLQSKCHHKQTEHLYYCFRVTIVFLDDLLALFQHVCVVLS